jgi:hypothetical protein
MANRLVRNAAITMCLLTSSSCVLLGQEFTGVVTDSGGAVVPKAQVIVHDESTNIDVKTFTTASGNYTVTYLKPGVYTVSVEVTGFRLERKPGITLQVGQTAEVDFSLQVGSTAEAVTVQANPLIDFSPDRGEVVETERVTELPLNARDPDMLSILNPGVVWTGAPQWQRPFDNTMANLIVNGGQSGNNELLVDGGPNESTDGNGRSAYVPPVDSVQEFKIITNPYNALYGRAAGGIMDLTLKSGTNKFHGDAYEFYRRGWLDANTWQDNYYGNTRESHKLDQYGAELDGPVRIPRVYDGRNKMFYLMQVENYNEIVPSTSVQSVPSPQWLQGDFSNLVQWNGSPITIYDPLTLHTDANGNLVRDPFPQNKIPASRLNSIAQTLVSYFPAPNVAVPSGQNPFANNFQAPNPTTDLYRNALAKIDYNLGANDKFSLRYGYWIRTEYRPTNGISGPAADGQLPGGTRSHTFSTEWVHTQTPNLVLAVDANVVVRQDFQISGPQSFDLSKLGWSSSELTQFNAAVPFAHFPQISFSEFDQIGNWGAHLATGEGLSIIPNLTWVKGRHTLHTGVDLRFLQLGTSANQDNGPFLWTDRTWTQQNYIPADWDDGSGNSLASFLLGTATNGNFTVQATSFASQHYYAPFIQDDWKVTKKLTLNLGVRWDLNGPQVERHNRWNGPFQFDVTNPVNSDSNLIAADLPPGTVLKGGISFVGHGGNPRSLYRLNKNNIQPRVGFIYAINDKTAIRGGVGEMFPNPTPGANTLGYTSLTNYVATQDNWRTPLQNLTNPYPQVVQPLGAASSLETNLGNAQSYSNPNFRMPNFWFYSFGVERQLAQHDVVELSYVGTQTKHLDSSQNMNPVSTQWEAQCNLQLGGNPDICNNNLAPNPFQNVAGFNGSSFYGATSVTSDFLTRPLPAFGDITQSELNARKSWYNSLQFAGSHRWSKSFTIHGTWTWSKTMDAGGWSNNADQIYGISARNIDSQDRTHRITLSGVYLLPVGRGRPLLGNANRLVDGVVGGWEIAPLFIHETGTPWTFSGLAMVHPAKMSRRLDSNGFIRGVDPCVAQWEKNQTSGQWELTPLYNTAANQNTGLYDCRSGQTDFIVTPQFGADPNLVYSGIRIPSDNQFDANLSKNFAIWERMNLQFRLEAFDVLNHPQWQSGFDSSAQSSTFGEIPRGPWGQSNLPREVQIAVKLSW